VANAYSPSCDVEGPAVAASTLAELERADLEGKIGILYGDLTKEPLTPKGCLLYEVEHHRRIIEILEEKQPSALVTVDPRYGRHTRVIEDWSLSIPSATVPAEVGRELLVRMGDPLRLSIATRRGRGRSVTLIGRKPGTGEERLVLCAHYDTKVETPGALDNGAGVAALLALAPLLAEQDLAIGLEFVAFSGEEYGIGQDDAEYIRQLGDQLNSVLAAINMDGIGSRVGANTIMLAAASQGFRSQVDELLAGYPGVTWTEPWPQSNHSTFSYRGVPAVALSSIGAWELAHRPEDTVEWVSEERVAEAVRLVAEIARSLEGRKTGWTREDRK
jgi:Iap family predicted aminopeptidase